MFLCSIASGRRRRRNVPDGISWTWRLCIVRLWVLNSQHKVNHALHGNGSHNTAVLRTRYKQIFLDVASTGESVYECFIHWFDCHNQNSKKKNPFNEFYCNLSRWRGSGLRSRDLLEKSLQSNIKSPLQATKQKVRKQLSPQFGIHTFVIKEWTTLKGLTAILKTKREKFLILDFSKFVKII